MPAPVDNTPSACACSEGILPALGVDTRTAHCRPPRLTQYAAVRPAIAAIRAERSVLSARPSISVVRAA
jgi:hypothetical protein